MPRPSIDRLYARAAKAAKDYPYIFVQQTGPRKFQSELASWEHVTPVTYPTATDAICAALWRIILNHRPANARKAKLPRVLRNTKTPPVIT